VVEIFHSTLYLAQELVISLFPHDYLAENVLDVHILPTVARISSHEASLVGYTGLDIVNCRCRCGLLKSRRRDLSIGSLLNAVNRASILVVDRSSLLLVASGLLELGLGLLPLILIIAVQ